MAKAPYVMQGYYRNPAATQAVLEDNGWLHTGDRGEFSGDGLLTLTGHKKALFKLSIGEYVVPGPIEQRLCQSPLVEQALVVGPGRKFCGLLIFVNRVALAGHARQMGLLTPPDLLIQQPQLVALYQSLVDQANATLPSWSTVKRFALVNAELTTENELLKVNHAAVGRSLDQPHLLNREALYLAFAKEIDRLYQPLSASPTVPVAASQPSELPSARPSTRPSTLG